MSSFEQVIESRPRLTYLLIFDVLRQDRELLFHYTIFPFIPERGLTFRSELVFETIPMMGAASFAQKVVNKAMGSDKREMDPNAHRSIALVTYQTYVPFTISIVSPQIIDFRVNIVLHLMLCFSELSVKLVFFLA